MVELRQTNIMDGRRSSW